MTFKTVNYIIIVVSIFRKVEYNVKNKVEITTKTSIAMI